MNTEPSLDSGLPAVLIAEVQHPPENLKLFEGDPPEIKLRAVTIVTKPKLVMAYGVLVRSGAIASVAVILLLHRLFG